MPVKDNPTLGHTLCSECEEVATVHQQTRGAGRFLYTRGCNCKYRNSTGSVFQTRLWRETDWLPDTDPIRPPNVEELGEVAAAEQPPLEPEPVIEPGGDESTCTLDPDAELAEGEEDDSVNGWLVTGLSILAGVAAFILTGGRRLP